MVSSPVLYPPPAWTNQDFVLYHGTIDSYATELVRGKILTSLGRTHTDFGPGFYTTSLPRQAHSWAARLAASIPGTQPAVVQLHLSRTDLARLESLAFVRGDFDAEDFWSLVQHCRTGATGHGRPAESGSYYDVVYGPIAAFWNQRMCALNADQMSFHTPAAEQVLNRSVRRRII